VNLTYLAFTLPDRVMGMDTHTLIGAGLQIFNTVVMVTFLYFILYKPVLKFLDNRAKGIADNISNAEKMLEDAKAMKAEYEGKIANASAESAVIVEAAKKRGMEAEQEIVAEARAEAERIKRAALTDIELEKQKVQNEMKEQIIDISTLLTSKYITRTMDESLQTRLLEEAIEDLGDATWLN